MFGEALASEFGDLFELLIGDRDVGLEALVDLGLLYGVTVEDDGLVSVDLTLTSPACPVGPMLQGMIYHKVAQLPNVLDVEVNLVWDPPWDPRTMASDEVKLMLGIW